MLAALMIVGVRMRVAYACVRILPVLVSAPSASDVACDTFSTNGQKVPPRMFYLSS
jgi:hypothetical protein